MMKVEKRTKVYALRVQPELLEQAQIKLDKINSSKKKRERKLTISDIFEEKLYDFVLDNKM